MNTKIALMQPYFFPYLGYFQLIAASDVFVLYDDTQLISRGWVNRNRILVNGEPSFITLPLRKGHLQENINRRYFADDVDWHKKKMLKAFWLSYSRAPFFDETYAMVEAIMACPEKNVAAFNNNLIRITCDHLGISTRFLVSSELELGRKLSGQERVIEILKGLHADIAINPIGGMDLYSYDEFIKHGIKLKFIKMEPISYRQFGNKYLENLSIIDVLMFCGVLGVQEMLSRYWLLENRTSFC